MRPIVFAAVAAIPLAALLSFLAASEDSVAQGIVVVEPFLEQASPLPQRGAPTTITTSTVDGVPMATMTRDEGAVWALVLTDDNDYAAFSPFFLTRAACVQAKDAYFGGTCLHTITGEVLQ